MNCIIFRAPFRAYTYLFVREDLELDELPETLRERFRPFEAVMSLEIRPGRKLANADPETVMKALRDPGYYLQLPPEDDPSGWLDLPSKQA